MTTLPPDNTLIAFPGFEGGLFAWVAVDGEPVKVHGVKVTEDKKAVAYIEAPKAGGTFEVFTNDQRGFGEISDSFSIRLKVDGQRVTGFAIDRFDERFSTPSSSKKRLLRFRGKRVSLTEKAPLRFGKLRTTDDEDAAGQASSKVLKNLGSIQLAYRRVQNVDRKSREEPRAAGFSKVVVHEQEKVVHSVSHQAEFGEARLSEASGSTTCDAIDPKSHPFTQIEIRYRSRELLELEGIVDPLPTFTLGSDDTLVGTPSQQDKDGDIPVHSLGTRRFLELKEEMDRLYAVKAYLEGAPNKRRKSKSFAEIERENEENRRMGKEPEVIDLCESD